MKRVLILAGFFLVFGSCSKVNDCNKDYKVAPPVFVFQFIDKNTGNDLFVNSKLATNKFNVVDEKGKKIHYDFTRQKEKAVLILSSIGWNLEEKQYTISLGKRFSVKILLDMDYVEEECYTSFKVKSFKIEDYEYHQDRQTGIIQIKI